VAEPTIHIIQLLSANFTSPPFFVGQEIAAAAYNFEVLK